MLVQRRVLTESQLQQALAAQHSSAARLGSCVIWLGLASMESVSETLSDQLGVPTPSRQALDRIQSQILATIPQQLCQKYRVLPLKLEGRVLHLGAEDPLEHSLIKHLSTGLQVRIRPYVMTELMMAQYLQRYYDLPMPERFGGTSNPSQPDQLHGFGYTEDDGESLGLDLVYLDEIVRTPTADGPSAAASEADSSCEGVADELDIDVDFDEEPPSIPGTPLTEAVVENLRKAQRKDTVLEQLLQPLIPESTLTLLLLPRGEVARALGAWGTKLPAAQVRSLVLPLTTPSILQIALSTKRAAVGPVRDDNVQTMISTFLQVPPAEVACIVPVCIGDRVANLICVQSTGPIDETAMEQLVRVANHAANAYRRLIKKG